MQTNTTDTALPLLEVPAPVSLLLLQPRRTPLVAPAPQTLPPQAETAPVQPAPQSLSALISEQSRPDRSETWLYAAIAVAAAAGLAWGVWDSLSLAQNFDGFERFVGQLTQ